MIVPILKNEAANGEGYIMGLESNIQVGLILQKAQKGSYKSNDLYIYV